MSEALTIALTLDEARALARIASDEDLIRLLDNSIHLILAMKNSPDQPLAYGLAEVFRHERNSRSHWW